MNMKTFFASLLIFLTLTVIFFPSSARAGERPDTFVDIEEIIPGVLMDIRYYGEHNFVGARVDGYLAPKCNLTREAARALAEVHKDLARHGLTLKIYDCYRPQRAVDHFVRWAQDIDDTRTKKEFYPTIDKRNLFRDGYIASHSSHSRGSTVDLTIVPLPVPPEPTYTSETPLSACFLPAGVRFADNSLDMGTGFDCFHEMSHPENQNLSPQHRSNRLLLRTLMEKHGFKYYDKEWWHFTLVNEPYPDTYFNFPVE